MRWRDRGPGVGALGRLEGAPASRRPVNRALIGEWASATSRDQSAPQSSRSGCGFCRLPGRDSPPRAVFASPGVRVPGGSSARGHRVRHHALRRRRARASLAVPAGCQGVAIPFTMAYRVTFIGLTLNLLLPGGMGCVARSYYSWAGPRQQGGDAGDLALRQDCRPLHAVCAGPLADYTREYLSGPTARRADLFDQSSVLQVLREHTQGLANHGFLIWKLLNLAIWHHAYLE